MKIYLNPINLAPGADIIVRYVSWLWELRTGVRHEYMGLTDAPNIIPGAVVVRAATIEEWARVPGANIFNPLAFAAYNGTDAHVICYSPYRRLVDLQTQTHEQGHVLDMSQPHDTDIDDIMYPYLGSNNPGLTNDDILNLLDGSPWPVELGDYADMASAVMYPPKPGMKLGDIWHPEIAGLQVLLEYVGKGTGYHHWRLASVKPCTRPLGNTKSWFFAGKVFIDSVKTPDMSGKGVHLERQEISGEYRLTKVEQL